MKKWAILAFTCMILNGMVLIFQKYVTILEMDSYINIYLGISYFIGFAACLAIILINKYKFSPRTLMYGLAGGISSYVGSYLYIVLMGLFPSSLLIPMVSIGSIVAVAVGSVVIFRERIGRRMIAAILTGILAVTFLCI